MLLPRIQRALPLRQWYNHRSFVAVPKYSPKVRGRAVWHLDRIVKPNPSSFAALPFAISKQNAVEKMALYIQVTTITKGLPPNWSAESLMSLISSVDTSPKHVQAVYLPAWIVDAETETNAWFGDSAEQVATVQLVDSYLPGYAHDFLSRISFNNKNIDTSYAVPFSSDLTVQHDSPILCLPFNISPLSLPTRLQYLPTRVAVADDLEFDPAIKINFLAAYPLLIPLYLVQYETETLKTTIIMEAFAPSGRIYFELFDDYIDNYWTLRWLPKLMNRLHDNYFYTGVATSFSNVSMPSRNHDSALKQWLDQMISRPGGPEQLVSKAPADFTDSRVREFTGDETDKNRAFLDVSSKMAEMKYMLQEFANDYSKTSNLAKHVTVGQSGISKFLESRLGKVTESHMEELQKRRDRMMPQWWKDTAAKSP